MQQNLRELAKESLPSGRWFWNLLAAIIMPLIAALLSSLLSSGIAVPLNIILPILIFLILSFIIAIRFSYTFSRKLYQTRLPKVIDIIDEEDESSLLFLLEPSELFSSGALVSFYVYQGRYERFVGVGRVKNVQEDGRIQVVPNYGYFTWKENIDRLGLTHTSMLDKLMIKPHVNKDYLAMLIEEDLHE